MKKEVVLLILILSVQVISVPLSQSSDWLGKIPVYEIDEKIFISGKSVTLVNTGEDFSGRYAVVDVDGIREKIYEKQTVKFDELEVYVDSVSDEAGRRFDTAVMYFAFRRSGRPQGIYKGYNVYEIKENGELKLNTGNHIIVSDVLPRSVVFSVDGEDHIMYFNEIKTIGRISIKISNILYDSRSEKGTAVFEITTVKPKPLAENKLNPYKIEKEETIEEDPKLIVVDEENTRRRYFDLDQILYNFFRKFLSWISVPQ